MRGGGNRAWSCSWAQWGVGSRVGLHLGVCMCAEWLTGQRKEGKYY